MAASLNSCPAPALADQPHRLNAAAAPDAESDPTVGAVARLAAAHELVGGERRSAVELGAPG